MSNKLHGKAPAPTPDDDEIMDLLSVDCQVSVFYTHTEALLKDIMEPALRLMLAKSGGIPPVGSVITLMMSVDRAAAAPGGPNGPQSQTIIMPVGHS